MTNEKTDKKPQAVKTDKPVAQRTRLTHAQWHQVATYVAGCVDPDTDHLSCTPSELVGLVRQDCELLTNPGQLREMCKLLGLTIRLDKPGAADVAALAADVAALVGLVQAVTADIEKIKAVLNQHAKRLQSGPPQL